MQNKLKLIRYSDNGESTLGLLYLDKELLCYTLENTYYKEKIYGKTRIPEGIYSLSVCKQGNMNKKYTKNFISHKGMIELLNVPNFTSIYIHIGNKEAHTKGCILLGDLANNNAMEKGKISFSTQAYTRIYKKIIKNILENKTKIEIKDIIV